MEARKLLGQLLIEAGRLTAEQLETALAAQRDSHGKLGHILVDQGAINTGDLLDVLSEQLLVAIAPAARLRLVRPSRAALAMVPGDVARARRILPIFYSEQEKSLTVVTSEPNDTETLEAVKRQNGLNRVRLLLAEESLLDELIPLHYGEASPAHEVLAAPVEVSHSPLLILHEPDDRKARAVGVWLDAEGYQVRRVQDEEGLAEAAEKNPLALIATCEERTFKSAVATLSRRDRHRLRMLPRARELLEENGTSRGMFNFYLKTLDFFLSLLGGEPLAPSHRHARQVSGLCRLVAGRLGLSPEERDALLLAGYLYQFGDYLGERGRPAQRVSDKVGPELVAELWGTFEPPLPVTGILEALGQPARDPAEEPLPVAILRAASDYLHLRDGTASRPKLGPRKALARLLEGRGEKYHTEVLDALKVLVEKEQKLDQLEDRPVSGFHVLLVDKDPMALEVLELRLRKEGFGVRRAHTGEEALAEIRRAPPNLVISEITLPRVDGFELCSRLKGREAAQDIPFFFLSSRSDGANVTKGLELGADDFLTKPINLDVLVSKVKRIERMRRVSNRAAAPTAVQGSLSELGIFDLLQVLQLGMKTARIDLQRDGERCVLHIQQGSLVSARLGDLAGKEAFYELCTWESGTFAVIAGRTTAERDIYETNDFLLMEGMRRADERRAGG